MENFRALARHQKRRFEQEKKKSSAKEPQRRSANLLNRNYFVEKEERGEGIAQPLQVTWVVKAAKRT